jgi:hypothetical protein
VQLTRRVLRTAAAAVTCALATTASAVAAQNPWQPFASCPVDSPAMLAAPAGSTSYCVSMNAAGASFNLGSKTYSAGALLNFGVPRAGAGTVVAPSAGTEFLGYDTGSLRTGIALPYADLCPIVYAGNPVQEHLCEEDASGLTGLDTLQTYLDNAITTMPFGFELAGAASGFYPAGLTTPGARVLTLPVKFHLTGLLVGDNCYVGTDGQPIILHLTGIAAPARTTTGSDPNGYPVSFTSSTGGTIGDDSFAEPGATGCNGLAEVVNLLLGLPRPAGHNAFTLGALSSSLASTQAGGQVLSQAWHQGLNR